MLRLERLQPRGLDGFDLELSAGECMAVEGPSGSGKTLLLRAIADLDPCPGEVQLDGVSRAAMPGPAWRRRVMYVAAESGWWAGRVGDHFEDWPGVLDRFGSLGLPANCDGWAVQRLSTGERQRLALLRALEADPKVLLLDEPTSGLDEKAVAAVEALLDERRRAVRSALTPTINAMAAAGVVALPGMMTGQILAGVDPFDATRYQLLIVSLIAGGTGLGAFGAVAGGVYLLTNDRHRLRLDRLRSDTG